MSDRLERNDIAVEWENIGEGYFEEYDENDPEDENLLRFYFQQRVDGEWVDLEDGSYCTLVPVETSPDILIELLVLLMDRAEEYIQAGNWKRRIAELSWIKPNWLNKEGEVEENDDTK